MAQALHLKGLVHWLEPGMIWPVDGERQGGHSSPFPMFLTVCLVCKEIAEV